MPRVLYWVAHPQVISSEYDAWTGADATRESPGIRRAFGPGDLGCGGGWPIFTQLFMSSRLDSSFTILIYLSQEPREKRSVISRWCSPRAAPAEVEVLATGVGPGWAGATPAYGRRGMKELSRRPERGWSPAWRDLYRWRLTGHSFFLSLLTDRTCLAKKWVPTKPDGTFLTGQIWLDNEFLRF